MIETIRTWLLSPWRLPLILSSVALLSAIPILFPFSDNEATHNAIRHFCGWPILLSVLASAIHTIGCAVFYFLRLANMKAIGRIAACAVCWSVACLLFARLAEVADVPSPYAVKEPEQIQHTDVLHEAKEELIGPSALDVKIYPEGFPGNSIVAAPNLCLLEQQHPDIMEQYLQTAPRWAFAAADDTFYTKPGHLVLVTPAVGGGIPGMVQASFRTVSAGSPLPDGYLVLQPGTALPTEKDEEQDVPDIAIDLGGKQYLLLAWRGVKNKENAVKAINAAISYIDKEFEPLAKQPIAATIQRMIKGSTCIGGNTPILRMSELTTQFGLYQAEFFANPGTKGTFILVIRELKTGHKLQIFSFEARYSDNPNELFRHDIPSHSVATPSTSHMGHFPEALDARAPFFVIKEGVPHQYFGVSVEVLFSVAGTDGAHTERLIRRCYNVQAFESPTPELPVRKDSISPLPDTKPTPIVDLPQEEEDSQEEPQPEPTTPTATEEPLPEPTAPTATEEPLPEPTAPTATEEPQPEPTTPTATEEPRPEPTMPTTTEEPLPEPTAPATAKAPAWQARPSPGYPMSPLMG